MKQPSNHPYTGGVTEQVLEAVKRRMAGEPWRKAASGAGVSLSQLQRKYPQVSADLAAGRPLKMIRIEVERRSGAHQVTT